MTNFEKLTSMSIEELAEWICYMPADDCNLCKYSGRCGENKGGCQNGIKEWLESEYLDEL